MPVGLGLIAVSFYGLTELTPTTSYLYFAASVFVMGAGMGVTMVPMFTGAMRTLDRPQVARASTSINIVQQSSAAIGTVTLSIVLSQILAEFAGAGALGDRRPGHALADQERSDLRRLRHNLWLGCSDDGCGDDRGDDFSAVPFSFSRQAGTAGRRAFRRRPAALNLGTGRPLRLDREGDRVQLKTLGASGLGGASATRAAPWCCR